MVSRSEDGSVRERERKEWKARENEELCNLYSSPDIEKVITTRKRRGRDVRNMW